MTTSRDIIKQLQSLNTKLGTIKSLSEEEQGRLEKIHKAVIQKLTLNESINRYKTLLTNTWKTETQAALIWVINQLESFPGEPSYQELLFYENYISTSLGEPVSAALRRPIARLDEGSYLAGANEVARDIGFKFQFRLPDAESLAVLNDNVLFWVGDYYNSFMQDDFRGRLTEYFESKISRNELAQRLRVDFRDYAKRSDAYWDLLADHTATKIREIGRVASYEQAEIEVVRVKAILDSRTSAICRRLHGTVISVRRLNKQVKNYLKSAGKNSREGVKNAWPWWSDNDVEQKLKTDRDVKRQIKKGKIGLPPYHGFCRTRTVAEFEYTEFDRNLSDEDILNGVIEGK